MTMNSRCCSLCEFEPEWCNDGRTFFTLEGPRGPLTFCSVCGDERNTVNLGKWHELLYQEASAGCCLHVVVDDGNIDDASVNFCVEYAEREGHTFCRNLGRMIQQLPVSERILFWCSKDSRLCHECGHLREDHCDCGSACLRCDCSRYRTETSLAPCPHCLETSYLVKVATSASRFTYRCEKCFPTRRES